jgi:hypothetical protein
MCDIETQVERLRMQGLHCGYTKGESDASVYMYLPPFMEYMSLATINKIVDELAIASTLGELDTSQKYMYWFLDNSGVIGALREVNYRRDEVLAGEYDPVEFLRESLNKVVKDIEIHRQEVKLSKMKGEI